MYPYSIGAFARLVRFKVYLLRNGGRRRAWRSVINGPSFVGDLRSRTVQRGGGRYHVLFEPMLVGFSPLAFQIRGFERVESTGGPLGVVQEWHCELP